MTVLRLKLSDASRNIFLISTFFQTTEVGSRSFVCKDEYSGVEHVCPQSGGGAWLAQIDNVSLVDKDGKLIRCVIAKV